ncbi:N-methylhydantoinase B/acetone carboxylase, alpha subunit [Frankia casuarinae]|uniref:Hydantoinase B/oxoprolinase n=1 Tax=Frankia casuarinae (strain DSM 45818 / CECT 9043 / HFP020203 / CcI3) TaxID=106370 RepID=Q2JAT2_FRACC|nr:MULTISPECIES: hydantoinase B/oxoprolinase family protein [Frankia]ABD11610.1 Hydantoinase B/oxoprolinase [Frankia casuarinae]ETA00113.1 N-methylhydantoinase B/acetone carboxylase, alpha subunit [Frankia sp. CcI6]EYT90294.1 N-methylhydantoinase B/acetone carboxylase, alpha subunit [Frankia casuarinae]KDA41120.1 N-methylhydantoinase B/acetone carboxylase, alpha subunit [Frankia sp. BMG5.23]OHV49911.1 acetone carboxylase subunit alpha [Frankia sp. CgIS1]
MSQPDHADGKSVVEKFLEENVLFLGPDPEIMQSHHLAPESPRETEALARFTDPEQINLVRHKLQTACNESFDMVEQMGAAPGAKWGDLISGVWTASGDLALSSMGGVLLFSVLTQHPVKFIVKYWVDEPTVGVREGDVFMHNDARYGNVHNTDQSILIPVFHEGQLICFAGAVCHEGENGATEPGGMPSAAESPFDEGLKISPIKVGENYTFRRDLMTFLQNSVREPKLQLEGMKAKLYAAMRTRDRIHDTIAEYGVDAVVATLRRTLTDTADEVRRRLRSWPEGTVRQNVFADGTLRENCLVKIRLAMTKKDDELILDFRGSSPEFLNRANNTILSSMKGMLAQEFLTFVWPDLPRNQAVFEPMTVLTDPRSALNCSPEAPNAQSMMTFFPSFTAAQLATPKLLYSAGERSTDVIAGWFNMIVTFIYGGVTQHGELVGNVCADLNGMGGAARSNRDGEHAVAPIFAPMADIGEQELIEEEVPILKIVPNRVMRDNQGFGKFRGGQGYQQIATVKDSAMWGFMACSIGSKFPSSHGIFGGYGPGTYPLCKIKNVDIFKVMDNQRELLRYTVEELMNERPFPDATYSTHHMGMQFELAERGELYMLTQGTGGGYGDVLERDPELVASDYRDGLVSMDTVRDIYHVVLNPDTAVLDAEGTTAAREAERAARLRRGKPYAEFVKEWETETPPADVPFFGSWGDPRVLFRGTPQDTCPADAIVPVMMPDPKDVRIAQLEAKLAELQD